MHIFPATFNRHSTGNVSQQLVFDVDSANKELIKNLSIYDKGSPVVCIIYDVEEGDGALQEAYKDKESMSNRFKKQIHAIIGEYAETTGLDKIEIKKILKTKLKGRGVDKTSLKDLSEQELATSVFILNTEMNPTVFDYEPHTSK